MNAREKFMKNQRSRKSHMGLMSTRQKDERVPRKSFQIKESKKDEHMVLDAQSDALVLALVHEHLDGPQYVSVVPEHYVLRKKRGTYYTCLLYTSDAADE